MKALYFEFSSEFNEIFEKLADELFKVDITDNKTYWIRPFSDRVFLKNENSKTTKLKVSLSPTIFSHLITNKEEQEKIDKAIDNFIVSVFKGGD